MRETNSTSLNELQELYDDLWEHHVLSAEDPNLVIKAIKRIIQTMDESQSLSVPFTLLDDNDGARKYLLAQSLLLSQEEKLQFFHPSFFDYGYAKLFTSRHDSLYSVVSERHQGIFIRSQVKQVLIYLRRKNFSWYLRELQEFFNSSNIRFHIRLLVINLLAYQEEPTDEGDVINELMLLRNRRLTIATILIIKLVNIKSYNIVMNCFIF